MCFSAGASFGAATLLTVVGAATIRRASGSRSLPFAFIPMIFAVQQFTEGILWLSLKNGMADPPDRWAMYIFLIFAQVVWPVWVPWSVSYQEKDIARKRILKGITLMGLIISVYLGYCLMVYPVSASISDHHISYQQDYPPALRWYGAIVYMVATIIPPALSGQKNFPLLSVVVFLSYLITEIFYKGYVVSVWCFFAAVISVLVYFLVPKPAQTESRS